MTDIVTEMGSECHSVKSVGQRSDRDRTELSTEVESVKGGHTDLGRAAKSVVVLYTALQLCWRPTQAEVNIVCSGT